MPIGADPSPRPRSRFAERIDATPVCGVCARREQQFSRIVAPLEYVSRRFQTEARSDGTSAAATSTLPQQSVARPPSSTPLRYLLPTIRDTSNHRRKDVRGAPNSDAYAEELCESIDRRSAHSDSRLTVVFRKVRTVVRESGGGGRRGTVNVPEIEAALRRSKIQWDEDLARADFDTYVCFSLGELPRRMKPQPMQSEDALRQKICEEYPVLFEEHHPLKDLRLESAETKYQHSRAAQQPDLVLAYPDGRRAVVELEVRDPQENSTFQILKYMNATNASLGVLITAYPSSRWIEENTVEMLDMMKPTKPNFWFVYGFDEETHNLNLEFFN